jgi:OOP family OmpA-OmpF porin
MRLSFFLVLFVSLNALAQQRSDVFSGLNSPYDERNPVLSPDGNTLFFTIAGHPQNIDGVRDPGDIWLSRKTSTGWSAPVHAGTVINNRAYNAVAGFSPDGKQLFLHGHYASGNSPARSQGIAVARATPEGWSRPENITIPYFLNKSNIISGSISADNTVFVFSAEGYGTYGVEDIYVSVKQAGQWTEPRNLGNVINSQFQELSPSLSADNSTLYFSSNGRKGIGSFDVYRAVRLDDSWTHWSQPENLGPAINTPGRDLFYRIAGPTGEALYTSTTSSEGYGDLRLYQPTNDQPLLIDSTMFAAAPREESIDGEIFQPQNDGIPDDEDVFRVYGKIADSRSGEAIAAQITFEGPDHAFPVTATAEGYRLTLPVGDYRIRIEARGYVSSLEKLDSKTLELRDLELNYTLQPVAVGTTVNLKNVLFAQSRTDILPESFAELDLVVDFMNNNPGVRIELMGHTDVRGVHADNVRLSQQRVDKVREYLISKGIDGKRITGKGYGGTRPIASNDTEESRRLNRRVEFVIRRL